MRRSFLIVCTLVFSCAAFCQQTFTLKISLPDTFSLNKLSVSYSDGLTSKDLEKNDVKHEIVISGNLHSLYGSVNLTLEADSVSGYSFETFFFGPGNSSIIVSGGNNFTDARLSNVFNAKENGKDRMEAYIDQERKAVIGYMRENESKFASNRDLLYEAGNKVNTMYRKQFSFIQKNAAAFYSFRLYHDLYTPLQRFLPMDTLMMVYRQFPDSFKVTEEGQYLLSILRKQDSTKNLSIASDFNVLDINGKAIHLKQLKGKYVILDFWATWCGPCMKEMPSLVRISSQYPENKLAFISVSLDRDTLAYTRVRHNLPATWIYIFGDESIIGSYGVTAIPEFYLIDPDGRIIFKCRNGRPEEYTKLEELLKERLKQAS
jgi:thiol-disulfide isomerase/thioredoxin